MNRGVWVGVLALGVSGWMSALVAEEASWRPVLRPPAPVPAVQSATGASIGRPIPITPRAAGSDPDWSERSAPRPIAAAQANPIELPARVPQPGEVIASSVAGTSAVSQGIKPVSHEEVDEGGTNDFAVLRSRPPSLIKPVGELHAGGELPAGPAFLPPPPALEKVGNWTQPYPASGPPGPPALQEVGNPAAPSRFWVSGEYLLWWLKKYDAPPLVTTSTNPADIGALNAPTTTVLFAGPIGNNPYSGARFTGGLWLDDCQKKGIEVSGFFLGEQTVRANFNGSQFPVLARPFQEFNRGIESSELVNFPNVFAGRVSVESPTRLWGIDANFVCVPCWCCDSCGCDGDGRQVRLLAGARYLDLREGLLITESVNGSANAPPPLTNTNTFAFDSFQTRNHFYGAQVGASSRWVRGNWSLDAKGKVALGVTDQQITINGAEQVFNTVTGVAQNFSGNLLALPGANIGTFSRNRFSVVPEVGVNLGYQILPSVRATVGYNFLYWSNVVRPGDQIDRTIDITRIPNFALPPGVVQRTDQVRPMVPFKETDFWAQGLTVGLEFNW